MDVIQILQNGGARAVSLVMWGLEKIYTGKKLSEAITITPAPHSEALRIDCLANDAQISIQVINFSPFTMKVDHCVVRLNYAGFSVQMIPDAKEEVIPFGYKNIFIRANLTEQQGRAFAAAQMNDCPRIEYNLVLVSKFGSCKKEGCLESISFKKLNDKVAA